MSQGRLYCTRAALGLCVVVKVLPSMGTLRDWNEALVAHFLSVDADRILFNVTETVIEAIHGHQGFTRHEDHPLADFIRALCRDETGYEVDGWGTESHTSGDVNGHGWPSNPGGIIRNAYELRNAYANRYSGEPNSPLWDWENTLDHPPPWTSHLALAILATSMNVGNRPPNSRYGPMADLLYSCTQNSLEEPLRAPNILADEIEGLWKQRFFGSKIAYRNRWVPAPYSVKFRDHEGQTRNFTPWRVLSLWSQHQGLHPGSFHRADGWITNPVTTHSRFREEDIEAAASCLQGLSTTVPPSPQVLNARIVQHAQQFRQRNYSAIRDRRLAPFRELAVHVWTHQTERIPNAPPLNHPQNNGSSFVLTPTSCSGRYPVSIQMSCLPMHASTMFAALVHLQTSTSVPEA